MASGELRIGDLATATATKVETVRYYERIGLLPPPARTAGNYRAYTPQHRQRLSFIRRARGLGFSTEQVREPRRRSGFRSARTRVAIKAKDLAIKQVHAGAIPLAPRIVGNPAVRCASRVESNARPRRSCGTYISRTWG